MTVRVALLLSFALVGFQTQEAKPFSVLLMSLSPETLRVEQKVRFRPETSIATFVLTSSAAGVLFDANGDGTKERVAWPAQASDVAFLVLDKNGNGRVDNGTELIGSFAVPGMRRAIGALRTLNMASNGGAEKGAVDEDDPLYVRLQLWCDRNRDGLSTPDELRPAGDVATKVGLGYVKLGNRDSHGNIFGYWSWFELRTAKGRGNAAVDRADHVIRVRYAYEVTLAIDVIPKP